MTHKQIDMHYLSALQDALEKQSMIYFGTTTKKRIRLYGV